MPPLYTVPDDHPLLTDKWPSDTQQDKRDVQKLLAEQLLGLKGPAYADADKVEDIITALVLQINFQLQHGIEPHVVRSANQSNPGNATNYRDRYVNPEAMATLARATGRTYVAFQPFGGGV
jgi:hypothetical protein